MIIWSLTKQRRNRIRIAFCSSMSSSWNLFRNLHLDFVQHFSAIHSLQPKSQMYKISKSSTFANASRTSTEWLPVSWNQRSMYVYSGWALSLWCCCFSNDTQNHNWLFVVRWMVFNHSFDKTMLWMNDQRYCYRIYIVQCWKGRRKTLFIVEYLLSNEVQ